MIICNDVFQKKEKQHEQDEDESNEKYPLAGNVEMQQPVYYEEVNDGMQQDRRGLD
jgi:hypothetical protein